jgi:hypothetical protein
LLDDILVQFMWVSTFIKSSVNISDPTLWKLFFFPQKFD